MYNKILFIDIETAPHLAFVWKLFKENIPLDRLIAQWYILSFAWAWGDGPVECITRMDVGNKEFSLLLRGILDDADIVIGHNSNKFDLPIINGDLLVQGLPPPSPYRKVDTYLEARKYFKLASNKLEYIARILGVEQKADHSGFDLWVRCINNDPEAFKEMAIYNKQDVVVVRDVYKKLLPWMQNHPNLNLFIEEEGPICPKCGGIHINWRGYATTAAGVYHRFQCISCGGWGRSTKKQNIEQGVRNVQ